MTRTKLVEQVLAEGEHTGHAHRITQTVYQREDGVREFAGATTVTHEEHGPITIPDGQWVSGRVQEYDYFAEMAREVND